MKSKIPLYTLIVILTLSSVATLLLLTSHYKNEVSKFYYSYLVLKKRQLKNKGYLFADMRVIPPDNIFFKEIEKIIFPGYKNILEKARKAKLYLREQNRYNWPTLLLKNNFILNLNVPYKLLLHLIKTEQPEIISLGSSMCVEAFRADVFVNSINKKINTNYKALNMGLNFAGFNLLSDLAKFLKNNSGKRYKLIILLNDDRDPWSNIFSERGQIMNSNVLKKIEQLSEMIFSKKNENMFDIVPSYSLLLDQELLLPIKFSLPSNIDKKYLEYKEVMNNFVNQPNIVKKRKPANFLKFEHLINELKSITNKLIIVNSPTIDYYKSLTREFSNLERYRTYAKNNNYHFDLFSLKDVNLTKTDFYLGRGVAEFDIYNHLGPHGAIKFSKSLANKYLKYLKSEL